MDSEEPEEAKWSQEGPGGARRIQEEPGGARRRRRRRMPRYAKGDPGSKNIT